MLNHQYNVGIDLLKIVAMFMIIILHILGFGGIVWNKTISGLNYDIAWLLEIASFCAVNCYALASGYVGINVRVRYYKLLVLWLQITFTSMITTLFFFIYQPQLVNLVYWINSLFPIFSKQYWYLTAYFGLFLILPIVNTGINGLVSKQRKLLFSTILVFLIIIPYLVKIDLFNLVNGYSLLWLLLLYILGACIAKDNLFKNLSKLILLSIYLSMVLVTFYLKNTQNIYWISYQAPTIVVCSISLLVLFSKMKIKREFIIRMIKYIASLTLGVYIFHEHPLFRAYYVKGKAIGYFHLETFYFICTILGMAFLIFASGLLFDACRKWIFSKLDIENRLAKLPYLN